MHFTFLDSYIFVLFLESREINLYYSAIITIEIYTLRVAIKAENCNKKTLKYFVFSNHDLKRACRESII